MVLIVTGATALTLAVLVVLSPADDLLDGWSNQNRLHHKSAHIHIHTRSDTLCTRSGLKDSHAQTERYMSPSCHTRAGRPRQFRC